MSLPLASRSWKGGLTVWCPRFISESVLQASPPTVAESAREAASQFHAKAAKLETALQAAYLDDHRKLMRADREKVRQLEQKRLGINTGGEDDVGDIIVADDVHVQAPPRENSAGKWLLGAAAGALFAGGPLATYLLTRATDSVSSLPARCGLRTASRCLCSKAESS
jgi:hypothetical protein